MLAHIDKLPLASLALYIPSDICSASANREPCSDRQGRPDVCNQNSQATQIPSQTQFLSRAPELTTEQGRIGKGKLFHIHEVATLDAAGLVGAMVGVVAVLLKIVVQESALRN